MILTPNVTREDIAAYHPRLTVLDPESYDEAIVGVIENAQGELAVAYDVETLMDVMISHNSWSRLEAEEWFATNIQGAVMGEYPPVFLYSDLSGMAGD